MVRAPSKTQTAAALTACAILWLAAYPVVAASEDTRPHPTIVMEGAPESIRAQNASWVVLRIVADPGGPRTVEIRASAAGSGGGDSLHSAGLVLDSRGEASGGWDTYNTAIGDRVMIQGAAGDARVRVGAALQSSPPPGEQAPSLAVREVVHLYPGEGATVFHLAYVTNGAYRWLDATAGDGVRLENATAGASVLYKEPADFDTAALGVHYDQAMVAMGAKEAHSAATRLVGVFGAHIIGASEGHMAWTGPGGRGGSCGGAHAPTEDGVDRDPCGGLLLVSGPPGDYEFAMDWYAGAAIGAPWLLTAEVTLPS